MLQPFLNGLMGDRSCVPTLGIPAGQHPESAGGPNMEKESG